MSSIRKLSTSAHSVGSPMIYACLIAVAVLCFAAGWSARMQHDIGWRRWPVDSFKPGVTYRLDSLDTPAMKRRQAMRVVKDGEP